MNLKEWAAQQGISEITAYRWFHSGKLPVPARKVGGLILVENPSTQPVADSVGKTVVYARVSSSDQSSDLDRQVVRVTRFCIDQGWSVDRIVTETGSGLNGHRKKFLSLLQDSSVTRIVVEHRDRLTRFGFEYLEAALSAQNRELVVVDARETDDDLVRDMTDIMTSMCARLYGKRGAKNRAQRAVIAAGQGDASA